MSLPKILHMLPATKTAVKITNATQTGLMGLGFHFVARATRTNPNVRATSATKTQAK